MLNDELDETGMTVTTTEDPSTDHFATGRPASGAHRRDPLGGPAGLAAALDSWLAGGYDELVAFRRDLHRHPELSGAERRTTALIVDRLEVAGLRPRLLPAGNGAICDIPGDPDGPIVALRADLDALPIPDAKDVPYRSTVDGVCHACGHDVHTTVVLGAGLAMAELAAAAHARGERLPCTVRLLFQPSEEVFDGGAPEMIDVGALDGVSQIWAVHCDPRVLVGEVGIRVGPLTASADSIRVALSGPGGHTARPYLTADVVSALGLLITDVPMLLARRVDPRSGMSLVFGAVHAGQAANTIPQTGELLGTVRILDRDAWADAPDLITELVHQVVAPTRVRAEVSYVRGVPPVVNDPDATARLSAGVHDALGPAAIVGTPQSMGGEDFSWYLEKVPGAMARLGVARPGGRLDLHQGSFDVDERAIEHGVRMLVHTALTGN